MRARVLVAQVVDVSGGDERQPRGGRDLRQRDVDALLHLQPRVLDLEVDGLAPEDVAEPGHLRLGLGAVPVLQRLADPSGEAPGEREQALPVRGEQVPVDAGLVVVALEVARRGELDQVRVALVRLGEEGEVGIALLLRQPVVGDVDLAAEERLDALLPRLAVELDRAGEAAVVRERDRRHLELGRARGQLGNPAGPVEDRVLGVDVEVDERRARHGHLRRGPTVLRRLGYRAWPDRYPDQDKTSLVIDRDDARAGAGDPRRVDDRGDRSTPRTGRHRLRRSRRAHAQRSVRDGGIGPSHGGAAQPPRIRRRSRRNARRAVGAPRSVPKHGRRERLVSREAGRGRDRGRDVVGASSACPAARV